MALRTLLALSALVLASASLFACQRASAPASEGTTTTQASSGSEPPSEPPVNSSDGGAPAAP